MLAPKEASDTKEDPNLVPSSPTSKKLAASVQENCSLLSGLPAQK